MLQLGDGIFFLPGPTNSLIVDGGDGGALLVDTGLDDAQARKLLRGVAALGLRPAALLNTHSHPDHHGGNAFLLGKFPGLPIYAPPAEAALIRQPMLSALGMFGAVPPPALRTKFLLAPDSPAQAIAPGTHRLGGAEVELLPVPGHALEMYAVRIGDVLYAADALFGPAALAKHPLTFCVDSAAQKASAAALAGLSGIRLTLPGHGDPAEDLPALVSANLESYARTTAAVRGALAEGAAAADDLLPRVCARLGLQMSNTGAALLNRAVVLAHLSEGAAAGWARPEVRENRLVWAGM